jgi:glycosyltransferase involved in cell wall biosynthesis
MNSLPTIILASNTSWSIFNFRSGVILLLQEQGFEVAVYAPRDEYTGRLESMGVKFFEATVDSKGKNVLFDLMYAFKFYNFLTVQKPVLTINYTIKSVIYGSIAARLANIPTINVVTGMGYVFNSQNWLTTLVRGLYKVALKSADKVFFLNREDRDYFLKKGLVNRNICVLLPGEGVDVEKFTPVRDVSLETKSISFILMARMLWEKGVGEFVEVAKRIKTKFPNSRFALLGFVDVENPGAIGLNEVKRWENLGIIEYLGCTSDVRGVLRDFDCVVLPSFYSEGLPRSLLEASAMGIPIITTDSVGCRDVVQDGVTGMLCEPKDVNSLENAIERMCALSAQQRLRMGLAGRSKVLVQFDEKIVLNIYEESIRSLLDLPSGNV